VPGLHADVRSAPEIYPTYLRAKGLRRLLDLSTPLLFARLYLHFLSIQLFHFLLVSWDPRPRVGGYRQVVKTLLKLMQPALLDDIFNILLDTFLVLG
jgi:hypothetical protein